MFSVYLHKSALSVILNFAYLLIMESKPLNFDESFDFLNFTSTISQTPFNLRQQMLNATFTSTLSTFGC